jgi:tRNA (mo5U34)-methyltransferase
MNCAGLISCLDRLQNTDWLVNLLFELDREKKWTRHGDFDRWQEAIDSIPSYSLSKVSLNEGVILGEEDDLSVFEKNKLVQALQELHPWRKGPFKLLGIDLDTEWRSDWKWDRLRKHISPLNGRNVLDVGCGNGYYGWRMLGEGARLVLGIDPMLLNVMQFEAVKKLHGEAPIRVLPIGIEDFPKETGFFDTVFSMGVLYHRRSPIDHLFELKGCLRSGGELVLETLVIEGGDREVLVPGDRYAQMRNVWFIPSVQLMVGWLRRCGFRQIRVVDVSNTTTDEQRTTGWMRFQSLADFLDPEKPGFTIEGLPAPRRAVIVAQVQ